MANIQKQIKNLPEIGGTTKGVYLPNRLIKLVMEDMIEREKAGDDRVSFAKVVQSILNQYYEHNSPLEQAA